ncbi:hypothetical protein [Corynebacterium sp. MSK310]|uniref:hypothetical protein n=1 Tax=Corynebacterium sp. MSK310 TaxID=3050223 RepID=UPI00254A591E|nr:hypothetical protein [Corynebacterium sp. MSK310]MDK8475503.1 hypothetical protein [Corynebacterium sp. MSK310]
MSNQHQVARLIHEWQQRHKNRFDLDPEWYAQSIAIELDNEGLLAPDLPQLFFEDGHCPQWEIPINDQGGGVATVRCLIGEVFIERHGHGFITSPAEAKQLAAALLAAANHQEEA